MTRFLCVLSLAICLLVGCGKLVQVEGQVLLNGKPLERAMIMFIPADSSVAQSAQTMTDAEGRFQLNTINKKGALPGSYKVVVSKTDFPPEYYKTDPRDMAKLAALAAQGKQV